MQRRSLRGSSPASLMLATERLSAASWETIWRRSLLMMEGTCSLAEYGRMTTEKIKAAEAAWDAVMRGKGPAAVLAPYLRSTRANARRLRGKT